MRWSGQEGIDGLSSRELAHAEEMIALGIRYQDEEQMRRWRESIPEHHRTSIGEIGVARARVVATTVTIFLTDFPNVCDTRFLATTAYA